MRSRRRRIMASHTGGARNANEGCDQAATSWSTYRVGQKSKLLILSEYVNKTEKTRGT